MSDFTTIQTALNTRLNTLSGLPAVAWENTIYTPTPGTPYIRPLLMFGTPEQIELGASGQNKQIGIFQIDLNYPIGPGWGQVYGVVDSITNHFKRGTKLTEGTLEVVCQKAYPAPPQRIDGWYQLSVTVQFYAYTDN